MVAKEPLAKAWFHCGELVQLGGQTGSAASTAVSQASFTAGLVS